MSARKAVILVGWLGLMVRPGFGQTASMLSFQGLIKDASGNPITGDVVLEFRIYDAKVDGNLVDMNGDGKVSEATGDVQSVDVEATDGIVATKFGPVSPKAFDGNLRWLEVRVNGSALSRVEMATAWATAEQLNVPGTGLSALSVGPDGKIGIGLDEPLFDLHVHKSEVEEGGVAGFIKPSVGVSFLKTNGDLNFVDLDVDGNGAYLAWTSLSSLKFETRLGETSPTSFEHMRIQANGRIGMGTTSPSATLHIMAPDSFTGGLRIDLGNPNDALHVSNAGTGRGGYFQSNQGIGLEVRSLGPNSALVVHQGGSNTTGFFENTGTGAAGSFEIKNPANSNIALYASTNGTGFALVADGEDNNGNVATLSVRSGGQQMLLDGNEIDAVGGTLYLNKNSGFPVRVRVLQIVGADLAEKFPASEDMKPGMVVEIDPNHAGKLRISREAYNRRVAGVVSGAGGLPTGAILGDLPGHEDAPAIALSGRVWVNCDAGAHAIEPGDLLTTSATPGHAMKVTHYSRAYGAVIGKAMTGLTKGQSGLVLVLVSLQ